MDSKQTHTVYRIQDAILYIIEQKNHKYIYPVVMSGLDLGNKESINFVGVTFERNMN